MPGATPVITSNSGGVSATINVIENGTAVTTVTATDADLGAVLTYSIIGGADAAKFAIDPSTGILTFVSAPNFEVPTDAGANNVYDVQVQVSDGTLFDTQSIAVTVTNQNEAPVISSNGGGSSAAVNVAENSTAVTTVTSTDQDAGATKAYSIAGGADAAKFTINSSTGVLSFVAAPDREAPTDAGGDNVYNVQVQVSDGSLVDTQSIAVTVTNVGGVTINGTSGADIVDPAQTVAGQPLPTIEEDVLNGFGGNDSLNGGLGNDTLDGGLGLDTMVGGLGDDTYIVDDAGDVVTEAAGEGNDTVRSSITRTLGANFENLALTGLAIINGTGNALNNSLTGNEKANILNGGAGADAMAGGAGSDIYVVDNAGDVITEIALNGTDSVQSNVTYTLSSEVENLTLTGLLAISGIGNASINNMTGNSAGNILRGLGGNDVLNGAAGADTMIGGTGNDIYVVAEVGDVTTEGLNQGTDTVNSSITHTLAGNVENLTLTGSAAINGTGNTLANAILGNSGANSLIGLEGNDTLNGGLGVDNMTGGLGDDIYVVDVAGDVVVESVGEGNDTVQSKISFTLADNFENLTLSSSGAIDGTGNSAANKLTGNIAANVLTGLGGNDIIDGGSGNDTMVGGLGDDTYFVFQSGDLTTELAGQGTDTVKSNITWTLAADVENLVILNTGAIDGTGNTLDNVITGGFGANTLTGLGGNDTLNGGAGIDTMIGGIGNDTYVVAQAGDITTEAALAGTDTVQSGITHTLAVNIENLTLTGTAAINGTGNAEANIINGNGAANTLNGLAGTDTMAGGLGNDTYIVDNVGDVVVEAGGSGTDSVQSSVTLTLSTAVENLTLTGGSAINGTGNILGNILTGNGAANALNGVGGNDTLGGGAGADVLTGGAGVDSLTGGADNDTFNFTDVTESGLTDLDRDTIQDFTAGDHIKLSLIDANTGDVPDQAFVLDTDASFSTGEIKIEVSGADLIVSLNNDADAEADMTFLVKNVGSLVAGDFIL